MASDLCDCERSHNGMGMAGRKCDCRDRQLDDLRTCLIAIRRRAIFGPGLSTGDLLDLTAPVAGMYPDDPPKAACIHAYDAKSCCGHPDDCTFIAPASAFPDPDCPVCNDTGIVHVGAGQDWYTEKCSCAAPPPASDERLRDLGAALQNEHRLERALAAAEAALEKAREALRETEQEILASEANEKRNSAGYLTDAALWARRALSTIRAALAAMEARDE